MKNIKNIIKKALLFTGSTLLLAACSLNVPPPDQFSDPDAITDVNTGRALLTSCYLSYPHQEYDFSLLGNDFCPTNLSGKDVETQNLYNWQDKNISNLSSTVWPAYYLYLQLRCTPGAYRQDYDRDRSRFAGEAGYQGRGTAAEGNVLFRPAAHLCHSIR